MADNFSHQGSATERPRARRAQRKSWQQQFRRSIGFFQMGISRENERIDSKGRVFVNSLDDGPALPTSAVAAPPRTSPTPAHRLGETTSASRRP